MGGQSIFRLKKWEFTFSPLSPWLTCGKAHASKERKLLHFLLFLSWRVILKKWDSNFVGFVGKWKSHMIPLFRWLSHYDFILQYHWPWLKLHTSFTIIFFSKFKKPKRTLAFYSFFSSFSFLASYGFFFQNQAATPGGSPTDKKNPPTTEAPPTVVSEEEESET